MSYAVYISSQGIGYDCMGGHRVYLGDHEIGWRPYDGSWNSDVEKEVAEALAALLREKLGWSLYENDEED